MVNVTWQAYIAHNYAGISDTDFIFGMHMRLMELLSRISLRSSSEGNSRGQNYKNLTLHFNSAGISDQDFILGKHINLMQL